MSIIRHFGRSYSNGSSFERATPTSRTFYFSEGSNGAAINENVVWYVDGASTNDQYPYTYSATAEFTAELRFQNGYTITSVDDVALSNDFSDPQYEWTITKSLNQSGDILTLTFTPDADDFNGPSVTIAIDENNTVIVDPTPPYEQYNNGEFDFTQQVKVLYSNGGISFGQPISYNKLIGRQDTRMESTNSTRYTGIRFYSELDDNGYPKIGSYVTSYSGQYTTEGYDVVLTNGGTNDENVTEDGLVFKFKNVIRYELDPNGYSYVAEIIDELRTTSAIAEPYGSEIIFELNTDYVFTPTFGTNIGANWFNAADPGENQVYFRKSLAQYLAGLRDSATEIHLSNDDGASWDIHPIDSISGNVITIQDTFNRVIGENERVRMKFEGDLIFPTYGPSLYQYSHISALRSMVSGDSFTSITPATGNMAFIPEGEYSYAQLHGKKFEILHNDTLVPHDDITYKLEDGVYNENTANPQYGTFTFVGTPSYIPFAPGSQIIFKFPAS